MARLIDDPRVEQIVAAYRDAEEDPDEMAPWLAWEPWLPVDDWLDAIDLMVGSDEPPRRAAAVDLSSLVAGSEADLRLVSFLARLARTEDAPQVLVAIVRALGFIGGQRAARVVVRLAEDDSTDVRRAVAASCSRVSMDSEDDAVQDALAVLARDADDEVRDRATFVLARVSRSTSEQTMGVLWERLLDADGSVRSEAIAGLVLRGTTSLHDDLFAMITEAPDGEFDDFALVEAAGATGESRFLEVLEGRLALAKAENASWGEQWLINNAIETLRSSLRLDEFPECGLDLG